ncbi:DNA-3-methyladenine glycosylase family protein [Congregibacter litoralis]|uniref:DNA-3-methyladenine glycosylase II n=1 Tax=Congregibacter litoralis KT71 TaxID=314285 RepID=A4ABI1_9GAMM|nr:DNA-3-methyladenine glycosylase [Congregibacter litoralis]EAQ96735.1 3-methyladenine DNA glycosylase/8-oxoguanine DNA glycosylase [Congregibacter litoralis KT71]
MARLTHASYAEAVETLIAGDRDLARVVARHGPPKLLSRPPGFPTLVYIIFEQQVSLASAKSTYDKVAALLPEFTAEAYLQLSDEALRAAGVSRQKARYTRLVAEATIAGDLPIHALGRKPDEEVRTLLTAITGIGNWTADVYLMLALRRPDLWPVGDLALVKAATAIKSRPHKPDKLWLENLGERYRPYRSVATGIFWRHYLHS